MATQFDPYHKWLGIPPAQQPPNYYRLLAVNLFESDPDVIESAADQRMVHLRSFQTGQHSDLSQRLLNEIAAAKLCLLRPDRRAKYDQVLRARLDIQAAPPPLPAASPVVPAQPSFQSRPASQPDFVQTADPVFEDSGDEAPLEVAAAASWQTEPSDPYDFTGGGSPASVTLVRRRKSKWPLVMLIGGPVVAVVALVVAINIFNSNEEENERIAQAQNVASASITKPPAVVHPDDKQKPTGNKNGTGSSGLNHTGTTGTPQDNGGNPRPNVSGDPTHPGGQTGSTPISTPGVQNQGDASAHPANSGDTANQPAGFNDKGPPYGASPGDKSNAQPPNSETPSGAAPQSPARTPIPSAEAQQKALSQLKEVLKDDYATAKGAEGNLTLARKLEGLARDTADDAASRYVMATQGLEMAVKFCDPRLASNFVAGITQNFEVDGWDLKSRTLVQLCQSAKTPEARALLAQAAFDLVDKALGEGRYDNAVELAAASMNLATAIKDAALHEQAREIGERARKLQKEARDFDVASQTLATSPDDVDANLVVGRFKCFLQDNWDAGLPLLVKGSDGPLHDVAMQELKFPPADAAAQIKVADLWWDLADKTEKHDDLWGRAYRARAAHWYQIAAPSVTGLTAVKAQKRIDDAKGSQLTAAPTEATFLDDLQEEGVALGAGALGKHGDTGRSGRVRVRGGQPPHALAMQPPAQNSARVSYSLDGKYKNFWATVATLEGRDPESVISFRVLGDGKLLWNSRPMQQANEIQECNVKVSGVHMLQLEVFCKGSNVNANAAWINPRLTK